MDLYTLSATEIRNAFLKGELSAQQITSYFLNRAEKTHKTLGSFLSILSERALQKAKELDEKRSQNQKLGSLAAIPIAIKDNMHIKGEITTCGSKMLKNYKAPFSATAIDLLEQEDAILIGKTNLDEFAMGSSNENSSYFPCHNPWHLKATPGGSSGGSAAAIASRSSLLATGSDTGGSIRQPASFCGVVGFKPTYGRVSRYGLVAFGSSLDQIGPFATNVKDAALMMEVMAKHCPNDATSLQYPPEFFTDHLADSFKNIKIGVPYHFLESLDQNSYKNFTESVQKMKDLGAEVIDIDLDILQSSIAVYYILATAEASTNLARFDGIRYGMRSNKGEDLNELYELSREEGLGKEVKQRILLGTFVLSSGHKKAYYKKAQQVRSLILKAYEEAFNICDVICMPTAPTTAFNIGALQDSMSMYLQDIFTISVNLAGLPAISIPSGFDAQQKPYGIQLIGPQLHDTLVMSYAHAFEMAHDYKSKIPPLFNKEF